MSGQQDTERLFVIAPTDRIVLCVEGAGSGVSVKTVHSGGAERAVKTTKDRIVIKAPGEMNREVGIEVFCEFRPKRGERLSGHQPVCLEFRVGKRRYRDSICPDFGIQHNSYRFFTSRKNQQDLGCCRQCGRIVRLAGEHCVQDKNHSVRKIQFRATRHLTR